MIKSAYLRVYLPETKVRAWEQHPARSNVRSRRWEPYGFVGESMIEDALIVEWRGERYVCPRRPQLRMLEGVLAMYRALEVHGQSVIIPERVARQADRELRHLRAGEPDIRSQILTSAWHVPLRWFVAFDATERVFDDEEGRVSLRYRTSLEQALSRIDRAVALLTSAQMSETLIDYLASLGVWLRDFPPESMVELDYGDVVELFAIADVVLDESAAEIWASIEAMAAGDAAAAAELYTAVVARWEPAQAVAFSN
ncbi:MAG: hypothetical protein ACT4OP_09915 [Actinomycetota bacterium]